MDDIYVLSQRDPFLPDGHGKTKYKKVNHKLLGPFHILHHKPYPVFNLCFQPHFSIQVYYPWIYKYIL